MSCGKCDIICIRGVERTSGPKRVIVVRMSFCFFSFLTSLFYCPLSNTTECLKNKPLQSRSSQAIGCGDSRRIRLWFSNYTVGVRQLRNALCSTFKLLSVEIAWDTEGSCTVKKYIYIQLITKQHKWKKIISAYLDHNFRLWKPRDRQRRKLRGIHLYCSQTWLAERAGLCSEGVGWSTETGTGDGSGSDSGIWFFITHNRTVNVSIFSSNQDLRIAWKISKIGKEDPHYLPG